MLDELITALREATGVQFAAYAWRPAPAAPYGVVSLEGAGDTVPAEDEILHQSIRGTVDLFMNGTDASIASEVQKTLNSLTAWSLNSIQFEEETRLVHWEWVFEYAWN